MKKLSLLLASCSAFFLPLHAQKPEFEFGAEVTSQYVWRGMNYGGVQFQPEATFTLGNFSANAWFSFGAADWSFDETYKEFDLSLNYTLGAVEVSLTNYHYFTNGLFNWHNDYHDEGTQLEAGLKYTISEDFPLFIAAYTVIAGSDGYLKSEFEETYRRAYSTYIELGYEWSDEAKGLNYVVNAGFTPWKGQYSGYRSAGFNNLSARIDKEWEMKSGTFNVFIQPSLNFVSAHKLDFDEYEAPEGASFKWSSNANIAVGFGFFF